MKIHTHLVNDVGRVANTHQRAARVDVAPPTMQLIAALERQVEPPILRLEEATGQ